MKKNLIDKKTQKNEKIEKMRRKKKIRFPLFSFYHFCILTEKNISASFSFLFF